MFLRTTKVGFDQGITRKAPGRRSRIRVRLLALAIPGLSYGRPLFHSANFRRTYLILDGLGFGAYDNASAVRTDKEMSAFIQLLLEQDFGNVNIAVFCRPNRILDPILDLADVSIRLLKAEPSPDSLHGYCRSRVEGKVIPELVTAGFRQPEIWLGDIEDAICGASDGL